MIQKISSVSLRTSGLSVHGLIIRNVPKFVDFHKINECNSNTLKTMFHFSLPIPRQLANKRSYSQSTYLSHILSSNGTKSGFHTKSKEVIFDTYHIIIIGFLINMQVQGQHPHQWAPLLFVDSVGPDQQEHLCSLT